MVDPVETLQQQSQQQYENLLKIVTDMQKEVQQEVQVARRDPVQTAALAAMLQRDLKMAETPAKDAVSEEKRLEQIQARGGLGGIPLKSAEQQMALRAITRAIEAAKEGIQVSKKTVGQALLVKLAEKGGVAAPSVAAALEANLADYLIGNKDITISAIGASKTDFERALEDLKSVNSTAARMVSDSIIEMTRDGVISNITEQEVRQKFEVKEADEGRRHRKSEDEASPEDIDNFIDDLKERDFDLYLTDKDKEFLKMIYFRKEFVNHIEEPIKREREKAKQEGRTFDERGAYEEASKAMEDKLIEVVDKILTRFSETNPEKYFEQVAQENFMRGIQTTLATLGSYLDRLKTSLEEYEEKYPNTPKLYKSVGLDPIKEDILVPYKDDAGKTVWVEKPRTRYKPLSKPEAVSLSGFASYMRLVMDEYIGEREYLHNSRSILLHPKDPQQGFYAVLGNYAEKMKTPALEEMFLLPNAELLQDAINLYDKFVDEQFASQDWQHTSDMFLPKTGTVMTRLEEEVLKALKKMHPEIKEESKLKSILFMAVGAHRGIFMTEEEKAAFADPRLTPDGKSTYTSYYTNDTDPLTPLNPAHFFWRWQAERSLPLWLFLPVEGYNPLAGTESVGGWDHRILWENLKKYKESFFKGRDKMISNPLLIDFMLDIGNVGGPSKRRGWRIYYTTEGQFVFKNDTETGKPTGNVDVLKTWKAIENIGYELCYDFIFIQRAGSDFLKARFDQSPEKREFFSYLYKNYFMSDPATFNESDLSGFIAGLDGKANELVELKLKRGLISSEERGDQIEIEKSNLFLSEALARLVAKRFPSKILRIDRDRFNAPTKDKDGNLIPGKSRWNKVREKMGQSSVEFDKVMKNLCLAEAMLRKDVSAKMKKNIKDYASRTGKSLEDKDVGFHLDEVREGLDFRLTEEKIRNYLTDTVDQANEVDQVIRLYQILQTDYIGENKDSQEFMRTFSRYLNPNITEEGSYTFTFGLDDTDMSLVAFRGAGGRLLARALKDTSNIEKNVTDELTQLNDKLHAAAINGKHDFSEIVGSLKKIRDTLVDVHGPDYAQKVAHHLGLAVINFFKQDTVARNIVTKWFVGGQPHSLAAEIYGGAYANIWEWDVSTIDQFIFTLRTSRVLPQLPYDPSAGPQFEKKMVKVKDIFGREKEVEKMVRRRPDTAWFEGSLRRDAGADTVHKVLEMSQTILPLFLAFMLWKFIKESLEEAEGKKKN